MLELFATRGYRQTSVSAICAKARVSRKNFYEEFGDREAALKCIYDSVQATSRRAVLEEITNYSSGTGGAPSPQGLIRAALSGYVGALLSDPQGVRVAFVEVIGVSAELENHRMQTRREWSDLTEGALAAVGGSPMRPWVFSAFIPSVNEFLMAWWQQSGDHSDREDLVEVLTSVLTHLLRER